MSVTQVILALVRDGIPDFLVAELAQAFEETARFEIDAGVDEHAVGVDLRGKGPPMGAELLRHQRVPLVHVVQADPDADDRAQCDDERDGEYESSDHAEPSNISVGNGQSP